MSVLSVEAVFSRTQFKTDNNVETVLKLVVKEGALTYRRKKQEKSSCAIVCFCTHKDYVGKSLDHEITYFHISDSFSHFKLNFSPHFIICKDCLTCKRTIMIQNSATLTDPAVEVSKH